MLRVGIIGCGGITERRHGPVLARQTEQAQIVALADVSSDRTALMGEKLGVARSHQYQDYEQMLRQESLDLVHICTPHHLHEAQAIAALQAGAHVFLEKPIATSLAEADRIIAAAAHSERKLCVCHNQLYASSVSAVSEQIQSGAIGDVFLVRTEGLSRSHVVGRGLEQNWRTSATAGGGGPLIDNGYHQVYRTVAWTQSPVKQVYARIGRFVQPIEVEDMALLLLEHENGATTSLQTGWCALGGAVGMEEIFGTTGQIRAQIGGTQSISLWRQETKEWITPPIPAEAPDELGFPRLVREFLDAIQQERPSPVPGEAARHVLSVVLSAYEAGKSGQPVAVA